MMSLDLRMLHPADDTKSEWKHLELGESQSGKDTWR